MAGGCLIPIAVANGNDPLKPEQLPHRQPKSLGILLQPLQDTESFPL
jgi:hypothetical protein